jgi:hypothetical protein
MNRLARKSATAIAATLFVFGSLLAASLASAQCDGKSGFAKRACEAQASTNGSSGLPAVPGAGGAKESPITTGFSDTIHLDTLPPTIEPKAYKRLAALDRTDDGAFILKAGIFEAYVQSFTLDTGDSLATKAGGYYPAPIKGKRARIVADLLKQAELHPDVPQPDIQALLLAIVQGANLEQMTPALQQTAARVLPQDTLSLLQGATQARAAEKALMNILNKRLSKDKTAQQKAGEISQAQQQAAVLTPPADFKSEAEAAMPVARGTWAQMPGGFYVRYLPEGFMKTRVQVIVPDAAIAQADPANPLVFDPTLYLAILCQAPAERLGLTLRPADAKR